MIICRVEFSLLSLLDLGCFLDNERHVGVVWWLGFMAMLLSCIALAFFLGYVIFFIF
jgi:hypothetical protein